MPSRRSISTVQWGGEGLGDQHISQPQSRVLPAPVSQLSNSPMALRRTMLVSNLFKHMKEIQNIDNGYALRFHR